MATIIDGNEMFGQRFQPKMKNMFLMYIENIPSFMVRVAARPAIQFETVTLDHVNIKRKVQGKGEWQDITITLYDPVVPSASQLVMEWVRQSHESLTGRRGYPDMYKKDISLKMLGPYGDVVEEWDIKGAFIVNTNFGDLDFAAGGEFTGIEITLAMDLCVLLY